MEDRQIAQIGLQHPTGDAFDNSHLAVRIESGDAGVA
jgi:hypothetical protein